MTTPKTPESLELQKILSNISIQGIYAIQFMPNGKEEFNIMTRNMKKISQYILTKTGKNSFEPNELMKTYEYLRKYLPSSDSLTSEQRNFLENKLLEFVNVGGKVETIHLSKFIIIFLTHWILINIIAVIGLLALCGGILYGFIDQNLVILLGFLSIFIGAIYASQILTKHYRRKTADILPPTFQKTIALSIIAWILIICANFLYPYILLILSKVFNGYF